MPESSAPSDAAGSAPMQGEGIIVGAPLRMGDKPDAAAGAPVATPSAQPIFSAATPAVAPAPVVSAAAVPAVVFPPLPPLGKGYDGRDLTSEEKTYSAIGYFGVMCLLPLLARRDSEYCQHHARQGIIFALGFMILEAITKIGIIPGWLATLVDLAMICQWLVCCFLALQGGWFRAPVVYGMSLQLLPPKSATELEDEAADRAAAEARAQGRV